MEGFSIPKRVLTVILVLFVVFNAGGGIYDILENPQSLVPTSRGWSTVHYLIGEQTLNESIFSMIMNSISFGGLFIAYKGIGIRYERNKANTYIIIGMFLFLIGTVGSYYLIFLKRQL